MICVGVCPQNSIHSVLVRKGGVDPVVAKKIRQDDKVAIFGHEVAHFSGVARIEAKNVVAPDDALFVRLTDNICL